MYTASYKTPEYYWQTRNWIIKEYEDRVNKALNNIKTGLNLTSLKQMKDTDLIAKNVECTLAPVAGGNANNVYLEGSNEDKSSLHLSDGTTGEMAENISGAPAPSSSTNK